MKTIYKNIAISGGIGTGKTTLSNNLAKKLGWKHINAGEFFREWYKKNNIPLIETAEIPEELDRKIDQDFAEKMKTDSETIFESRLAGFLAKDLKDVFKVLCVADYTETAKRASKRDGISLEEALIKSKQRDQGLREKFKRLYKVEDYLDHKHFNLVVDTTTKTPEQVLEMVLTNLSSNEVVK